MKAVTSTTSDDLYLFNLPIVTWAWRKLGIEVICFTPRVMTKKEFFVTSKCAGITICGFSCPDDKAATYAQNARLYAGGLTPLDNEILIVSDVDMLPLPPLLELITTGMFNVVGADLVPEGQVPMCYLAGSAVMWRELMEMGDRGYQKCLDDALAHENCENIRGNLWARDQENAAKAIAKTTLPLRMVNRARPGTQFADHRIDRDDSYWEERLSSNIIDAHLWRPLWEPANFENLLTLMRYFWPNEDLTWVTEYRNSYVALMQQS